VFPHYRILQKVILDRDPQFTAIFTKELCQLLGVKQNISMAYHPQMDGQSECMNQSLEQYLRLYCRTQQEQWAWWLPVVQYTQNSWPLSTTKKSPFELLMGYMPQAHQPMRTSTLPTVQEWLEHIKEARKAAQETICKTQDTLVIGSGKFMPFKEGDKVWLEGTNLKLPYETPKLSPRWYRPFRVAAKILDMAYQLDLPEGWKIHSTFHASLLTPYKEMEAHRPNFIEPPLEIIEGEQEWEVEKILRDQLYQKSWQYLVWWKGYSLAHDS
jgi:hypothetical protein